MPLTDAFQATITQDSIYEAIADVLDPELDEPLVKLGFIDRVQVDGPDVTVVFKLPTYWCAPNFAYLMATDLRNKVRGVPGVRSARVLLLDHCVEDELNSAINSGKSFAEAFEDDANEDKDLEVLRRTFLRKGFLMRQDALLRHLLKAGLNEATIAGLRIADMCVDEQANLALVTTHNKEIPLAGMGQKVAAYLRRRAQLGLSSEQDAPLIVDDQGQPLHPGGLAEFLRRSRSIRLNIMFNTSMCKGLFRTRYQGAGADEAHRDEEGDSV